MEETRTTIHADLMRRNNFLRENPNFFRGQILPIAGKISPPRSSNDTARSGAYCVNLPAKVAGIKTVPRGK